MKKLHLENIDHTNICYEDGVIIFPSKHKIYSSKPFNDELQELITIARLMGMKVKVSYERKLLKYYFVDDNFLEVRFTIQINKRNRVVSYFHWDSNGTWTKPSKDLSLLKEIKRKL